MDKVRAAGDRGFLVLKMYELYEYEVTKYDPKTGEEGDFVQYIDTFLKLKAKASGYPGWVQRPEDKDKYVQFFQGDLSSTRLISLRTRQRED